MFNVHNASIEYYASYQQHGIHCIIAFGNAMTEGLESYFSIFIYTIAYLMKNAENRNFLIRQGIRSLCDSFSIRKVPNKRNDKVLLILILKSQYRF